MKLLVQSTGKILCAIWNLGTKIYSKFVTLRSFFKRFRNGKKVQIDSKKSRKSFKINCLIIYWIIFFFTNFFVDRHHYFAKYMFLTFLNGWFFSDFCYIAKYWNSDRVKLLAGSVYVKHPYEDIPTWKSIFFVTFSKRETIQKYVLEILLRNFRNWLSYS